MAAGERSRRAGRTLLAMAPGAAAARRRRDAPASLLFIVVVVGIALCLPPLTAGSGIKAGVGGKHRLPRGASPERAALFDPALGSFTCADGSRTLPFE